MSQPPHGRVGPDSADRPGEAEIREELRRILESPIFRRSHRCHAFLDYVVQKALAGQLEELKERNLAVDVFGRAPEANLTEDSIVRVGAREVRSRLAQYYVTPKAAEDTVHIDLPAGSYMPEFRRIQRAQPDHPAPPQPAVQPRAASRRTSVLWLAAAFLVAGPVAFLLWPSNPDEAAFRQFWSPFLQDKAPLLIAVAHPIVYHPSARATQKNNEIHPPPSPLAQQVIRLPANELDGSDMIPVIGQYVGFGDLVSVSDLAVFFARKGKESRLRLASQVEFPDLKEAPGILVGAYTNRWTIQLSQSFRLRFAFTTDGRSSIQDAADPKRQWALPGPSVDGSALEDYLLIVRLVNSNSGKPLLIVAGLKQYGTEAGGRLLVSPEHLGVLLRRLPADWPNKNLELVLHARVIGNSPAPPDLEASHLW